MTSKDTSDVHISVSESGAPQASLAREDSSGPPAKVRKVESDSPTSEDGRGSPSSSKPISSPCTCRCNGCCCHGTATEPQHCVRCHTDYKFNHPEACAVPHVFTDEENFRMSGYASDASAPSVCCGSWICAGDPRKGDWQQPCPCFLGWHTTDVDTVEEQYNGINVLRCELGHEGMCVRTPMKHSIRYELLYDQQVKYNQNDKEDHEIHLKRRREQMRDDRLFKEQFKIGESDEEDEEEDEKDKEEAMREKIRTAARERTSRYRGY